MNFYTLDPETGQTTLEALKSLEYGGGEYGRRYEPGHRFHCPPEDAMALILVGAAQEVQIPPVPAPPPVPREPARPTLTVPSGRRRKKRTYRRRDMKADS